MKIGFLVFPLAVAIAFGGIAYADVNYGVPYTRVTESDAESFATGGKDEKEILKKFGPPNSTDTYRGGVEVWMYLTDPNLTAKTTQLFYAGFDVFFKNKKVTYLGIIRGRNSN